MKKLFHAGRVFYGIAIAGLGAQTIYDKDFPYMLIPPVPVMVHKLVLLIYFTGTILFITGACIVFQKWIRSAAVLLGFILLVVFCLYYLPYEFLATSTYLQLGAWDNAEKELALSGGAFVIAGCYNAKNENSFIRFIGNLIPFGTAIFSFTILSFGIDHFLYAKDVAEYIPSWISNRIVWAYIAGVGLFGSGIAILLKIKIQLIPILLGSMIFTWFVILHIPKVIDAAPGGERVGETTSALLALAYCGTAFVIAGMMKNFRSHS
ncbi:MAG: hypothetical protein C5B52_00785 [Bacteroidetes bacterium]|nr:MAG: hypothetical protein C5B52_00785 [Bacteroidota bacterium]